MVVRKLNVRSKSTSPKKLAVVTCHFNWHNFKYPVANLNRFLRQMEWQGVPVFGIELRLDTSKPFATGSNPNWQRVDVGMQNILFQKEACINRVVDTLPPEFTNVAWVDADLEFSNPHAFDVANSMLHSMKVVQMFDHAVWTNRAGVEVNRRDSCIRTGMDSRWLGHPGFAWAARREMFSNLGGLYSTTPVGHGDTVFALAVTNGQIRDPHGNKYGIGINTLAHDQWADRIKGWVGNQTGIVDGECWHAWHGELKNRQYVQRSELLKTFDHEEHLFINHQGILEWKLAAPQYMREYVVKYFENRQEDTES